MKLNKLIQDLRIAAKVILHFSRQHHVTLSMIEGTYARQPLDSERIAGIDTTITIKRSDSFYKVTRTDYVNNISIYEEAWLPTGGIPMAILSK